MPDDDDKTVKELIDAATRAELEKWFTLPSFQQVAEKPPEPPAEDPEWVEFRKRRAAAIAAVDPGMLEAHRRRVERQRDLKLFEATIEPRIKQDMMMLDQAMIDRGHTIAEPREYELPHDLTEAMTERTPQALLRDLHRPETMFDKLFEIVDPVAESRVDLRAVISEALTARPSGAKPTESRVREARQLVLEARMVRRKPWIALTSIMRNRRVTE